MRKYYGDEVGVPDDVTRITANAFDHSHLHKIVISDSVKTLNDFCLSNCENLQSITFGNGVKTLTQMLCVGCKQITEVIIPEGIETLDEKAEDK